MRFMTVCLAAFAFNATALAQPIPVDRIDHIHGVAFDLAGPGFFVATHTGLFHSTDAGMVERVSTHANDYMGFTPHPTDPAVLFASGHPATGGNLGFVVSTDGGETWSLVSGGARGPVDFHALTVSRDDPDVIYGLYGGIQVSRDGGRQWSVAGPGPDDQVIDLAASGDDADTLMAGAAGGLWLSSDGGVSWRRVGPPGVPVTMVETAPDGSLLAYLAGLGLFTRTSGGQWEVLAEIDSEDFFMHLTVDPSDLLHMVAATRNSVLMESTDGGASWRRLGQ